MSELSKIVQQSIPIAVFIFGGLHLLRKIKQIGTKLIDSRKKRQRLTRWKDSPKDIVILHTFGPGIRVPNPSPFALKLETFLKMANIKYEIDTEYPKGDKDKTPWITLNGEHFTDSQLIIDLLEKKFGKIKDAYYNPSERAVGTMARIMMDEHFYWGLILWRYVYCGGKYLNELFSLPKKELEAFKKLCKPKYETFTWYQGIGRHSKDQVIKLMSDDLRALSLVIGSKTFLLGDEPCSDDCAVFGMVAQIVWAEIESPYARLIEDELPNLKLYCNRMRERFWPDWDDSLA